MISVGEDIDFRLSVRSRGSGDSAGGFRRGGMIEYEGSERKEDKEFGQ